MTTIYRKHGKRYLPIGESGVDRWDWTQYGAHLVVVAPGMTSWRYRVKPDHAGLLAAFQAHREELAEWILELRQPDGREGQKVRRIPSAAEDVDRLFDRLMERAK